MGEAPREIWARPRVGPGNAVLGWEDGHWRCPEPASADADFREVHEIPFTRADIADRYRAALEKIAQCQMIGGRIYWSEEMAEALREALAKGDEFSPPAQAENETKG